MEMGCDGSVTWYNEDMDIMFWTGLELETIPRVSSPGISGKIFPSQ